MLLNIRHMALVVGIFFLFSRLKKHLIYKAVLLVYKIRATLKETM
ncbi:hypothetical protein P378_04940 [Desulforamulus profundi]|uniref:Uncharacterized protein n=1 Tax=Desulforamulus profundi TaxID=1383067 RepID=A0A2C6MIB7_9FIRM|nr:hypothetical protein P378_04940 [Desulforamulus profundi]